MYSSVAEEASDSISLASSRRKFGRKSINSELSEPLTVGGGTTTSSLLDEEVGSFVNGGGDPYFVFRKDLHQKLELVDEALADFLRIVHETVRSNRKDALNVPWIAPSTPCIFFSFATGHCRQFSRIQGCQEAIQTSREECRIDVEGCSYDSSSR